MRQDRACLVTTSGSGPRPAASREWASGGPRPALGEWLLASSGLSLLGVLSEGPLALRGSEPTCRMFPSLLFHVLARVPAFLSPLFLGSVVLRVSLSSSR